LEIINLLMTMIFILVICDFVECIFLIHVIIISNTLVFTYSRITYTNLVLF